MQNRKRTDAYRPCGIQKPDPRQRVQADRNTHGCGNRKTFRCGWQSCDCRNKFHSEEANGSVELSFTFDASALSGKTLVAFETMTFEDHEVAVHADIKDANQTIYFPEIKTTAKDGSDGDQDVSASKEATIVDTVTYHGLMPGSEYKVIGTLMNKETGEALLKDGKPVTAQAEFKSRKSWRLCGSYLYLRRFCSCRTGCGCL